MPFVVVKTPERVIIQVVGTQAAANTFAARDASFTAHVGNVAGDPQPGEYLTTAGVVQAAPLGYTSPSTLQATLTQVLGEFAIPWLEEIGRGGYPAARRAVVEDTVYWSVVGLYLVMQDDSYSTANKVKYAEEWASIVNHGREFYAHAPVTAPTAARSWVNQTDPPTQTKIDEAVAVSGTVPAGTDLLYGDWVADLT